MFKMRWHSLALWFIKLIQKLLVSVSCSPSRRTHAEICCVVRTSSGTSVVRPAKMPGDLWVNPYVGIDTNWVFLALATCLKKRRPAKTGALFVRRNIDSPPEKYQVNVVSVWCVWVLKGVCPCQNFGS